MSANRQRQTVRHQRIALIQRKKQQFGLAYQSGITAKTKAAQPKKYWRDENVDFKNGN